MSGTPSPVASMHASSRSEAFAALLVSSALSMTQLGLACSSGVPAEHRATAWKLLLRYLPLAVDEREALLETQRRTYLEFKEEWVLAPARASAAPPTPTPAAVIPGDPTGEGPCMGTATVALATSTADVLAQTEPNAGHGAASCASSTSSLPVSTPDVNPRSKWAKYTDAEVRDAINKDVHRTYPSLHFFRGANLEMLYRILYVFAKTHRGIGYVQGMNELLAPLLYVIGCERGVDPEAVEADTFFCFANLMGEVRDMFIRRMDEAADGVQGVMSAFARRLAQVDPDAAAHLHELQIVPEYYSFRWLTTLLAREFQLPDTLRLWDSLLSDPLRFLFLHDCCVAMIVFQRDELLRCDFGDAMHFLQNYPPVDVSDLLALAQRIRNDWPDQPPEEDAARAGVSSDVTAPNTARRGSGASTGVAARAGGGTALGAGGGGGAGGGDTEGRRPSVAGVASWLRVSADRLKTSPHTAAALSGLRSFGAALKDLAASAQSQLSGAK